MVKTKMKSRYNTARKQLIFWCLFIGLGAVAGSVGMITDPTGRAMGMDSMLLYFKKLPFADVLFKDYLFSGFALLIVNGVTNLTAAILMLCKKKIGTVLGGIFGVTLMLWICIQFYMFPLNFMSTIYFVFGFCQALTGYCCYVFSKQEAFVTDEREYKNIGTNPEKLVVYYSRTGNTKRIAYEKANQIGAEVYEIKSTENTKGNSGYWKCGRFAMSRRSMPIEDIKVTLEKYGHVTICSPIWVFRLSCPIRAFCEKASGKIKEADLICVHFSRGKYLNAKKEVERLLKIKLTGYEAILSRMGKRK